MPRTEFFALLTLLLAMSFTPGPNTVLSAALAANRGLNPALRFACAVPLGWAALFILGSLGLGALVLAAPSLGLGIRLLGVGYLLWLAWQLARSAQMAQASQDRLAIGFWQGLGLQFVNFKVWLLVLAIVGGWVTGHDNSLQRCAIVLPLLMAAAFASNLTYAMAGFLLRGWLAQGLRLLWFNRAMASVLVLTAFWILLQ